MGFPSNIGKVYVKEQAGSWGTAETSFSATDLMSAKPFLPKFVQEALQSQVFRGGWHAVPIQAGSRQGADFTIEHTLQGWSTGGPSGDPTEHPDALLHRSVMGGGASYGYRSNMLHSSGQTTTLAKYTNGQATSAGSGMGVLYNLVGGSREIAWHKTFADGAQDDFALWQTMAAAPDYNGGTNIVYGGRTCWQSLTQPTPFTCQVYLGQSDGAAAVQYRDCVVVSARLEGVVGKLPKVVYGVKAGYWSVTGSWTVAQYTDNYPEMPPLYGASGSRVLYASSPTLFPAFSIELTADVQPADNFAATDGFKKYIVTNREMKVEIKHLVETYASYFPTPGTELATGLQIDLNTTPGRGCSYFLPTPQVASVVDDEDASGIVTRKTTYMARPTALETAGANAANSHGRVVFV